MGCSVKGTRFVSHVESEVMKRQEVVVFFEFLCARRLFEGSVFLLRSRLNMKVKTLQV